MIRPLSSKESRESTIHYFRLNPRVHSVFRVKGLEWSAGIHTLRIVSLPINLLLTLPFFNLTS